MAIGDFRLTTSRYVRPGVYIGYVRIPRPVFSPGVPRYPCYVGRGHRLAIVSNQSYRRAYVEDEELSFSTTSPNIANLDHGALNDKLLAFLYKLNREVVPSDKWIFREAVSGSGIFNQVEISSVEFDKNATYYIDYQSVDRDVLDELTFDELRQMVAVGNTPGENKYLEFVDYRIVTSVLGNVAGGDSDALIPDTNNAFLDGLATGLISTLQPDPPLVPVGDGTIVFNTASSYTHPYSMKYELICRQTDLVSVGNPFFLFELIITPVSGGNSQVNKVPVHSVFVGTGSPGPYAGTTFATAADGMSVEFQIDATNQSNFQLDSNHPFTDGVHLDFGWTAGFGIGDAYTWYGFGPGMIELSSAHDNTNQFAEINTPVWRQTMLPVVAPAVYDDASSGDITVNPNSAYTDSYDRSYRFRVYTVGGSTGTGPAGNRTFDIRWTAFKEAPYTEGVIEVDEIDPTSYTNVSIEDGIFLDVSLGAGHTVAADLSAVPEILTTVDATDLVSALTLATAVKARWDDHDSDVTWVRHVGGTSQHQTVITPVDAATLLTFCQEIQTLYAAHLGDANMHTPIDTTWTLDPDIDPVDLITSIQFINEFKDKFNRHVRAFNFVQGDEWTMTVLAPRQDYTDKDNRTYSLTVGNSTPYTAFEVSWYTDTYEGSFGSYTVPATNTYTLLPDNITLVTRNYPVITPIPDRIDTGDNFSFTTVNENKVDWSLRTRLTETIKEDEIFQDVLGRVTGVPLSWYTILSETPDTVLWVKDVDTGSLLSYTLVLDQTTGDPTPYIMFVTNPNTNVSVYYEHRGKEPAPGSTYYVTAYRLRSPEEYEVPVRYLTRDAMDEGLAPKTTDNHLWIAGDIAFDTAFFGAYFCQVKDASGNQIYTIADFRSAIDATESVAEITDVVVLAFYPALAYAKSSIEKMADPFERKERMLWVGVPIGTPLGDVDTQDSLIYLSKKTLQFSGDNPGRGHIVLIANDRVSRTLILDDGTTTRAELDGSFLAAYTAARNAEFTDPAQTLLRKDCSSFEDMRTFGEKEQILLGDASITWLDDVGSGVYRYGESTTVDTSAPDLQEISAMNQKMYVTRKVRTDMDVALISVVPPSPAAGVSLVRAFLADELQGIVSSGIIAPYGSEQDPPTVRPISPSSDLYVFVDELDRRLYHFGYYFNIRYPIKRLFGLYSVDTKFWDSRQ